MTGSMANWLEEMGLSKYAQAFSDNDIGLDVVGDLTDADLRELGVSLGDRKRMLRVGSEKNGSTVAENPAAAAASTPVPAPAIAIIAPQHLSHQILSSRAALEGERKQVTVLFADIKGSTDLISDMEAEAAAELLRVAITEMMAAVHQYEGTVNKVLGDGIMAIFGAPIAHEDHAIRACYAALAMQARFARLAPETRAKHGIEIQIRQGINSGDVVVRAINNDLTMDYDAIGPTVHLAGRMEQMAPPGSCRLTLNTYRLAEGFVEAEALGEVPVRGLPEPVEVYTLTNAVDIRSRFLARQRGRLTRFVGRVDEMVLLEQSWAAAQNGEGQSLSVVAEAGVGKSRLYYEFVHSPGMRGVLVLESGSVSHAKASAFGPVIELLRSYLGIVAADDERHVREKVIGKLVALDDSLRGIAGPILALLGSSDHDSSWAQKDPAQRRRAMLDAPRTLLLREAQEQPLVIIFEDLHWIDAETQSFLDLLVDGLGRVPILALFNFRPEYPDPWTSKSYHTSIRIDPLPPESGEEMLLDLLGSGSDDIRTLCRLLLERTEGYPFYIEETVQGLVEEGHLSGERGNYTLTVPVERVNVPSTVQSVISARIDRLPPESKRLLQTASVIGKDFELPLLRAIADASESEVQEYLSALQHSEFIYETRLFPEAEYTFKHALTHQVSYESLLAERRREQHRAIVAAMEQLHAGRLDERLERLVYHGRMGEEWEKVRKYGMAAGRRALTMSANQAAVQALDHAAEALRHMPATEEFLAEAIDVRFLTRDALFVLGGSPRITELMEEARTLADGLEDRRRLIEVLLYQSGTHWSEGRNQNALGLAEEALELAEAADDRQLSGVANYRLATAAFMMGDYQRAAVAGLAGAEQLINEASTLMRFGGLVQTFVGSFAAVALAELGRFDEAIVVGRQAYETACGQDHAYSISVASFGIGHALGLRGDYEAAVLPLEHGLRQVEVHGVTAALPWVAGRATFVRAGLGRTDEIAPLIEMVLDEKSHLLAASMRHPVAYIWSARGCIEAKRYQDAGELIQLTKTSKHLIQEDLALLAWSDWLEAEFALRTGAGDDGSIAACRRALVEAERLGMRPLAAHCQVTVAALTGDKTLAAQAAAAAREMGMRRLQQEALQIAGA